MRHLLPIFAAVFVIASLLIYLFGDSGLTAYRRLDAYRQSLSANVDKLQQKNASLTRELASLREDPQRSLVMARQIGLYQAGDAVLKLEGLDRRPAAYEVGDLVKLRRTKTARTMIFKATGIGICSLFAAFVVFSSRASRRKAHGGSRIRF